MAMFVFLGRLEDLAGAPELSVPLGAATRLATALGELPAELAAALTGPKVRIAVNGQLVTGENQDALMIEDADEVAFLPPVSGG
jgi:molybdopterin synthase sulfur carrier subunit